jgi:hypothetical protein
MNKIPEGWTDDMNIVMPSGHSVDEIVDYVIAAALEGQPDSQTEAHLRSEFGLSENDAALARDRVFGGIVRTALGRGRSRPNRKKDPFAWTSFQRAMKNPSIVTSIYPQFSRSPKKPWWRRLFVL